MRRVHEWSVSRRACVGLVLGWSLLGCDQRPPSSRLSGSTGSGDETETRDRLCKPVNGTTYRLESGAASLLITPTHLVLSVWLQSCAGGLDALAGLARQARGCGSTCGSLVSAEAIEEIEATLASGKLSTVRIGPDPVTMSMLPDRMFLVWQRRGSSSGDPFGTPVPGGGATHGGPSGSDLGAEIAHAIEGMLTQGAPSVTTCCPGCAPCTPGPEGDCDTGPGGGRGGGRGFFLATMNGCEPHCAELRANHCPITEGTCECASECCSQ